MDRYYFSISRGKSPLEARQIFSSTDAKLAVAAINSIIDEGSAQPHAEQPHRAQSRTDPLDGAK